MNAARLLVSDAVDRYMAQYSGRDPALSYRLNSFADALGRDRDLFTVTDDDVFRVLKHLEDAPSRYYAGRDADGLPIFKARGKRSPATLNRYRQSFAAVCTWAIRQRITPKGWVSPCRGLAPRTEPRGRVRFLDDDERARLLAAARASSWPRLYVLVLLALTTGARRGELMSLTWADVDLERALARVHLTKNGEPRVLPLLPAVIDQLDVFRTIDSRRFEGFRKRLVFHSDRRPEQAFTFQPVWDKAIEDANLTNFRFHDLRHSCASYLAQNGASLLEIADVLGHRTLKMVQRYSHLSTGSKAALVNRVLGDIR